MEEMRDKIRETVRKLFEEKKIDTFVGFREGTLPLRATPCFITEPNNAEKLVWNSFCHNNLAVYLPRFFPAIPPKSREKTKPPRVGILAKGCDCRSIVGLVKEHQIPRENVYIIGIPCDGMIDVEKIRDKGSKMRDVEIVEANETGNKITIVDENKKKTEFKKEDLLADACLSCQHTTSPVYDILIGEKKVNEKKTAEEKQFAEFEKKTPRERWEYFEEQVSKCIRCYACREACPNCYCKECFAETTKPKWIGISTNISDVMFFQLGRIFHQAGRCIDCGACVRACPMNIDLRMFTYKVVKDVKELFDYEAGTSLEEIEPLATFKPDDKQEFITEP